MNYFQEAKSKRCAYKQDGELPKFLERKLVNGGRQKSNNHTSALRQWKK